MIPKGVEASEDTEGRMDSTLNLPNFIRPEQQMEFINITPTKLAG